MNILLVLLFLAVLPIALAFVYNLFKIDKLLIIVTIYVFIIDASGGLTLLPLKEILFLMLITKLIYNFLNKGFRDKWALPILTISLIIPFIWTCVSILRGNNISYMLGDVDGYIFLLSALSLSSLIYFNPELKNTLLKHFIIACSIISLATIFIAITHYANIINIYASSEILIRLNLGFSGILDGSVRIFLKNQIYIMVAFLFTVARVLTASKIRILDFFLLLIFAITLYFSQTKGLWLGALVGLMPIISANIFSSRIKMTYKKFISLYFVFFGMVVSLIISLFTLKDFWNVFSQKAMSTFNFSTNVSNQIRVVQFEHLLDEFVSYPIMGKGFGATLSSGYYRSDGAPYSFELSYFEQLYKLGSVGMALFVISLILLFVIIFKLKNVTIKYMALSSLIAVLVVGATNPFIVSSLGMFMISVIYAISRENYIKHDI